MACSLRQNMGSLFKDNSRVINIFVRKKFTMERKIRSNAGSSIFNDEKKRNQTFTAFNAFKKQKHKEFRENPGHIPANELKNKYKLLPVTQK